jgi:uncharacterized radical SAM superfamily Fe-S cluster-containing enzyme
MDIRLDGRKEIVDINFYMDVFDIKQKLREGVIDNKNAFEKFESDRNEEPVVYNIETTNICNMHCEMCPAPSKMTRSSITMSQAMFEHVVDQLKPWTDHEWAS